MSTDPDCTDVRDASSEEVQALAEAEKLARGLPAPLLRDTLKLLKELVDRPGPGSLKIDKAANGKVFQRAHGNEIGSAEYDLVRER